MKKSRVLELKNELMLIRQGRILYAPDPPAVIDDPEQHQRGVDEICKLNGLPLRKWKPVKSPYIGMTLAQIRKARAKSRERSKIRHLQGPPYSVIPYEEVKTCRLKKDIRKRSPKDLVLIPLTMAFYDRIAPKAFRAGLNLGEYLEKMMGKR